MKKKKTNPNRIPKTTEERLAYEQKRVARLVITIFLSVLNDKFGMHDQLYDVYKEIEYLSDSIAKGYVNVKDLMNALREEGISV